MKKRPILLKKISNGNRLSRETIGFIGAHHGAGVTYTGILLAFYMGCGLGRRIAYLECNNHHDLSFIEPLYKWSTEEESMFSFDNITFYKDVAPNKISEIFNNNYDCLIFDFGTDFMDNRNEFLRCGTKIVIGGQAQWNIQKLIRFIKSTEMIRGNESWLYFIPCADMRLISKMKNIINRSFYAVYCENDPTRPSKENCQLFARIF